DEATASAGTDRRCLSSTREAPVVVRPAFGPIEGRNGATVLSDVLVQFEEIRNHWTACTSPPDAPQRERQEGRGDHDHQRVPALLYPDLHYSPFVMSSKSSFSLDRPPKSDLHRICTRSSTPCASLASRPKSLNTASYWRALARFLAYRKCNSASSQVQTHPANRLVAARSAGDGSKRAGPGADRPPPRCRGREPAPGVARQ